MTHRLQNAGYVGVRLSLNIWSWAPKLWQQSASAMRLRLPHRTSRQRVPIARNPVFSEMGRFCYPSHFRFVAFCYSRLYWREKINLRAGKSRRVPAAYYETAPPTRHQQNPPHTPTPVPHVSLATQRVFGGCRMHKRVGAAASTPQTIKHCACACCCRCCWPVRCDSTGATTNMHGETRERPERDQRDQRREKQTRTKSERERKRASEREREREREKEKERERASKRARERNRRRD